MTTVTTYNLYFDSKYRTGGTNSEPTFALPSPISLSNPNHRFTASVKSADIPFSFKSLTAPFNTLRCQYIEVPVTNTIFTLTIDEGNYSITTLLQTLISLLNNAISPLTANVPLFTFTYDKNTGYVTLLMSQQTGANATTLNLFWSDANTDFLANFFGFLGDTNTQLAYNAGGVQSYVNNVSQIHVICSPISSLYIRSSTLSQPANNDEFLVEFAGSVSDILLKIPVNQPYNTWLSTFNSDVEVNLNNKIIDTIQFYLTALSYIPLNLSGVYWRLHLQIKEIRDTYLDDIEKEQARIDAEIRNLEMMKQQAIQELEGVSGELRSSLMTLQGDEPQKEKTKEVLKQELLQEIEQNRGLP